ncbi:M14 family metallopeptidase [Aquiflexum sp. LQ15W]|uniref:M14 family metallopeptidase n=1 Tax=Cognataquiflexum nitidum TaxID=2922272 RepID=UPI001F1401E3|nr:M14 family metallopeptidase [Cognataquiflexum nitidum]MCH6201885.1 M14 family metallopeptidase [Cognataquiflexum nitidum]
MKKNILMVALGLLALTSFAVAQEVSLSPEKKWPEQDKNSKFYTVSGERHGQSFFKKYEFPEVQYTPGEKLTFDIYHTPDVMYHWYKLWAEKYPDITELYEVAKSYEGRPILQMTITNKKTGKHTDKPAAYFEGGRHGGEVTASEAVFWLTQHLLENYGKDPEITKLIDTKTVYVRPQNNPDGTNMYLFTEQQNRSTVRPHDTDRDGLLDEDPSEDLDGDGIIRMMRKKAVTEKEKEQANFVIDPRDPKGRLMKRVFEGKGDYIMYSEGIDNDGDGKYNEDGIGGLDLHRNYPENWRPDTGGDETGRGYTQFGAGEYPLSEIETRSTVLWLLSHPNISVVNSLDTRVPMHLRPPSTSSSAESMFLKDRLIYEYYDSLGMTITGYPWAGDVYETYSTRGKVNRLTGDPLKPSPLFGHGPDFGYFYYGAVWYGDELWNNGAMKDYDGDGQRDDYDGMRWDDEENGSKGFKNWEKFNHPQLGEVEIGGSHPKFFSQNGPPWQLESWIKKQSLFNLAMALDLPQIEIKNVDINKSGDQYEIKVTWTNSGKLPVALDQAKRVKIVQEDRLMLEFDKELTKGFENAKVQITTPDLYEKIIYAGYTEAGETKEAVFKVKVNQKEPVKGKLKLLSTRGGYIEREFTLGN